MLNKLIALVASLAALQGVAAVPVSAAIRNGPLMQGDKCVALLHPSQFKPHVDTYTLALANCTDSERSIVQFAYDGTTWMLKADTDVHINHRHHRELCLATLGRSGIKWAWRIARTTPAPSTFVARCARVCIFVVHTLSCVVCACVCVCGSCVRLVGTHCSK